MRRREFVGGLFGGAVAWPLAAVAQQPAMSVVGFLSSTGAPGTYAPQVFHEGLRQTGYIEGRNVGIEYHWADGRYDRLPALAADLVRRQVAVIVVLGNTVAALAAKAATANIPIVFTNGSDPVKVGLVESLNRPGANVTGVTTISVSLVPKRVQLLHEVAPTAANIAFLANTNSPNFESSKREVQGAASMLGVGLHVVTATSEGELAGAFASIVQQGAGAIIVAPDSTFNNHPDQVVALATQHRLPAIYGFREFAVAGGLMSYGTNLPEIYRQIGVYTGRILRGEKPADLPVQQPTKFQLVINLKTAKRLGLDLPATVLALADEVIE